MKLNSDNPNTMPITDSVYGTPPKRAKKPEREHVPQPERPLWRIVPRRLLDLGGRDSRAFEARRRKEEAA